MKEVRSYQTTDGFLFTERELAMTHELSLTIRGIMQSSSKSPTSLNTLTYTQAAKLIIENFEKVNEVLTKYKISINRMKKNKVAKVPVAV